MAEPLKLTKAFDKSLWVFHLNSGSCNGCDIEIVALLTPKYDAERFGVKLVGTPKHADVFLITGPVTRAQAERVKLSYLQGPGPKAILAIGNCCSTTGVYHDTYNVLGPIDHFFKDIDPHAIIVYVPGCPPRPEAITWGVVKAWEHLETARGEE